MNWTAWSPRLKEALDLTTEPVAVTFTNASAPGVPEFCGKVSVCQAIKRAAAGETITVTVETCGCPGGLVNLGLGQVPASGQDRLVSFLVDKEKVYCSRVAIHRGRQTVEPPAGIASHVVFGPLGEARLQPDLVLLVGTPGSLHRLLTMASYWDGGSVRAELTGPACRTGVSYPVVTGQIGLSLFDSGARRLGRFADDELLVGVPLHRMILIMNAIERGAGGALIDDLENAEREIEGLGKVEAV